MSQEPTFVSLETDWKKFLSQSARHSHILMSWVAVFLFPAFVLLDYLVLKDWEVFFIVRLFGMLAIVSMLSLKDRLNFGNDFIAHFSCHVVDVEPAENCRPLFYLFVQYIGWLHHERNIFDLAPASFDHHYDIYPLKFFCFLALLFNATDNRHYFSWLSGSAGRDDCKSALRFVPTQSDVPRFRPPDGTESSI